MRKAWILLVILLLVTALLPASAAGEDLQETNEETGYRLVIHDEGGLLDPAETESVLEAMRPILQYANAGFLTYPPGGNRTNSATKAQNGATESSATIHGLRFLLSI